MAQPDRLSPTILATSLLLAWGALPAGPVQGRLRDTLRNDLPSRADYERMERGYYEQLLDAGRNPTEFAAPVTGKIAGHAEPVEVEQGRLTDKVNDVREFILKPNMTRDPGRRIPWSTNSHGMRDREHAIPKPPGTFRIALVGDSIAAGWGVADLEGFEPLIEYDLGRRSVSAGGPAVEMLNFAVPGHGPGQRWSQFATIGWGFEPDLVIFEATPADAGWDERRLRAALARGIGFDAPVYSATLAAAGVRPGLDAEAYRRALKPHRRELLAGVYRTAVAECHRRGVPAFWILIPRVGKPVEPAERADLVALAHETGFDAVIDVCDVYAGLDATSLAVGPNDFHPNAEGHRLIARALLEELTNRPEIARLWASPERHRPAPPEVTDTVGAHR